MEERPKSLGDPAGPLASLLAMAAIGLIALAFVWAAIRYHDLDKRTHDLAASQGPHRPATSQTVPAGPTKHRTGSPTAVFPTSKTTAATNTARPTEMVAVVGKPGDALRFEPNFVKVALGTLVLVRNTSMRPCTMTAGAGSQVPAVLEGESNSVLEASITKGNHTVTFVSPKEKTTVTLRCDYKVLLNPSTQTPATTTTTPDTTTTPTSETLETPSATPTSTTLPSKDLIISWG
jgi:plastocyanin